ncbi:MAG: hypothetical protein JWR18_2660, partial [Segetibacter sp.]|nr:hypothetical protein [Segetibacter sp.]
EKPQEQECKTEGGGEEIAGKKKL